MNVLAAMLKQTFDFGFSLCVPMAFHVNVHIHAAFIYAVAQVFSSLAHMVNPEINQLIVSLIFFHVITALFH